ncbi:carbonic anhydrase [Moniliophthora roreri MCA 2997]|uniref:Carbonic anhydrase n=1 Tax=Moniliophthora roreri (strain MCA 2997) TaxID=1381753 RepID=V2YQM1_MONRO|nr:carbonic anhydrase [Moniliophthora roreri MCA 2997]
MIKARFCSVFLRSHNALYPKRFGHVNIRYCATASPSAAPVEKKAQEPTVAIPPAKKLIILTCMDARINHDALRSIIISQRLLGTRKIAVYHHTGCGMVQFTTPELRQLVKDADPSNVAAAEQIDKMEFLEFNDLEQSVKDDVKYLQDNPLVLKGTEVTGWIHYVETGKATRVV